MVAVELCEGVCGCFVGNNENNNMDGGTRTLLMGTRSAVPMVKTRKYIYIQKILQKVPIERGQAPNTAKPQRHRRTLLTTQRYTF